NVSKKNLWILFILGTATIVLNYLHEVIGFVGLIVMLSYVLYLHFRKQSTDSLKDSRVNDFNRTGLHEPAKWEEEAVSKRIEELHQDLLEIRHQQRIHQRLEELYNSLDDIQSDFQKLEIERKEWLAKISDIPELSVENIDRYSSLYWFLKDLQEWQKYNK